MVRDWSEEEEEDEQGRRRGSHSSDTSGASLTASPRPNASKISSRDAHLLMTSGQAASVVPAFAGIPASIINPLLTSGQNVKDEASISQSSPATISGINCIQSYKSPCSDPVSAVLTPGARHHGRVLSPDHLATPIWPLMGSDDRHNVTAAPNSRRTYHNFDPVHGGAVSAISKVGHVGPQPVALTSLPTKISLGHETIFPQNLPSNVTSHSAPVGDSETSNQTSAGNDQSSDQQQGPQQEASVGAGLSTAADEGGIVVETSPSQSMAPLQQTGTPTVTPAKRGRGRPRKKIVETSPTQAVNIEEDLQVPVKGTVKGIEPGESTINIAVPTPKRRGRPRKSDLAAVKSMQAEGVQADSRISETTKTSGQQETAANADLSTPRRPIRSRKPTTRFAGIIPGELVEEDSVPLTSIAADLASDQQPVVTDPISDNAVEKDVSTAQAQIAQPETANMDSAILPENATPSNDSPAPKRRGRPRKSDVASAIPKKTPVKRKRGTTDAGEEDLPDAKKLAVDNSEVVGSNAQPQLSEDASTQSKLPNIPNPESANGENGMLLASTCNMAGTIQTAPHMQIPNPFQSASIDDSVSGRTLSVPTVLYNRLVEPIKQTYVSPYTKQTATMNTSQQLPTGTAPVPTDTSEGPSVTGSQFQRAGSREAAISSRAYSTTSPLQPHLITGDGQSGQLARVPAGVDVAGSDPADSVYQPSEPSLVVTLRLPTEQLLAVAQRPPPKVATATTGWQNRRKMALALTERLAEADNVPIPDCAARLACSIQTEVGNLILSADMSILEFFALSQFPPQTPQFSLLISNLEKDPHVSPRKASPVTIRFKSGSDWRGPGVASVFIVAQTDEGYRAMSDFREKVFEARITFPYHRDITPENVEPVAPVAKPFKCDKCQHTFKNKNGLEYHLEKSQTACNPNFVYVEKPVKEKRYVRKKNVTRNNADATVRPKRAKKARLDSEEEESPEPSERGENSDSSIDSIFEWAQQVAAKDTRERPTSTRKKYKALQGETAYLEKVAAMTFDEIFPQPESDGVTGEPELAAAPTLLTNEVCETVLLDIVRRNSGAFPGDKSIWFALVEVWLRNHRLVDILPGTKLCATTIDDLLEAEKLKKHDFNFRDKKSRDITRCIYLLPEHAGDDESLASIKASIIEEHPNAYVPEGFKPPPNILERLQQLVLRMNKPANDTIKLLLDDAASDTEGDFENDDDAAMEEDDMSMDGMADDFAAELEDELSQDMEQDMLEDARDDKTHKSKKRPGRAADAISKGVIAWHVRRRAAGLAGPLTHKTKRRHDRMAGIPTKRELIKREKEKRIQDLIDGGAWGVPPVTRLQNPNNGAWSTKPLHRQKRTDKYETLIPRGLNSGYAEPITFIQAENGAWSQRPYGHGVKPIYARPSKRFDNSGYLKNLHNGFRPILIPDKYAEAEKRRREQYETGSGGEGRQRKRRKTVRKVMDVDFPEDEAHTSDLDFEPGSIMPEDDDMADPSFASFSSRQSSRQLSLPGGFGTSSANPAMRPGRRSRVTRNSMREPTYELTEWEIINQIELPPLPAGSAINPGLSSLPSAYGLEQQTNSVKVECANMDKYDNIRFVAPELVKPDPTFEEDHSWVLLWSTSRKQTFKSIRFDEATNFAMDTLPYDAYQKMEDDERREEEAESRRLKLSENLSKFNANIRMVGSSKHNKIARIKKLIPTRPLVAIEADFDGITEDPKAAASKLGVELFETPPGEYTRKRLRLGNRMSASEECRFVVTIVVIRVLTGGVDQFIDWVLVQTMFPNYSMNYLTKMWTGVVKNKAKEELLDELAVDFQDAFLVAYQNGTIEPLNYDKLLEYNWLKLVKWTMKTVDTSLTPKTHKLTAERDDLNREYHTTVQERTTVDAQTMYFHPTAPIYRRLDAAASTAEIIPIDVTPDLDEADALSMRTVMRTWARATALTPIEMWNSKQAYTKLTKFNNEQIEAAIGELLEQKVVIKRARFRSATGRAYEGSDIFATPLRKPIPGDTLVEALQYKELLDEEFRSGKTVIKVDYMGNDGSYMCISHLQASGQIIFRELDIPNDPMGLGDDEHPYDTKRIPKKKVKWSMEMRATSSYMFNSDNPVLQNLSNVMPPRPEGSQALPAWYTILEEVYPDMWKRILVALASTVTLRSGISTKGLQLVFRPTLEEWELCLLMRWGSETGIWQQVDEDSDDSDDDDQNGHFDAWCSSPHWWLILGVIVKEMDTATDALKARFEAGQGGRERASVEDEDDVQVKMDVDELSQPAIDDDDGANDGGLATEGAGRLVGN